MQLLATPRTDASPLKNRLKEEYKEFHKVLGSTGAGLKREELVEGSRAKNMVGT
jgi:hypothetical protein